MIKTGLIIIKYTGNNITYLPDIDKVSSSPAIAGYGEVAGLVV